MGCQRSFFGTEGVGLLGLFLAEELELQQEFGGVVEDLHYFERTIEILAIEDEEFELSGRVGEYLQMVELDPEVPIVAEEDNFLRNQLHVEECEISEIYSQSLSFLNHLLRF